MRKLTTAELVAAKPPLEVFRSWPRFPIELLHCCLRPQAGLPERSTGKIG